MKTKRSAEAEAAYLKGMAKMYRKQGKEALAKSYEMGSLDVFSQPAPKGNLEQ